VFVTRYAPLGLCHVVVAPATFSDSTRQHDVDSVNIRSTFWARAVSDTSLTRIGYVAWPLLCIFFSIWAKSNDGTCTRVPYKITIQIQKLSKIVQSKLFLRPFGLWWGHKVELILQPEQTTTVLRHLVLDPHHFPCWVTRVVNKAIGPTRVPVPGTQYTVFMIWINSDKLHRGPSWVIGPLI